VANRAAPTKPARAHGTRCAIYTRKSTEEGLEQAFNSLDAQREACAAYILSQRHEGWTLVKDSYDDGGFSGGNMARPGLKRLLADVETGKVDIIVVYKVDRLTRALSDFAKIVEILDARGASFVSVTQAFNTTTSMGRLTLNVLLSFAQFEREVTGERIRDKIAASKAKGMWMGGSPPIGYDVKERKLVVNKPEAETVRHIFRRYVALGTGQALAEDLRRTGYRTKLRGDRGGVPFGRGMLFHLLSNQTYIGKVVHRGVVFEGEQEAIVPTELWDAAQATLATNRQGRTRTSNILERSLLAGRIVDGEGRRMSPSHAVKGSRRYRYYVTHSTALVAEGPAAWRIAAHDIENLVVDRIAGLLTDRNAIVNLLPGSDATIVHTALDRAVLMERQLRLPEQRQEVIDTVLVQVRLAEDHVAIDLQRSRLLPKLGSNTAFDEQDRMTLVARATRVRQAKDVRLVLTGDGHGVGSRNEPLVALLAEARLVQDAMLAAPPRSIKDIAQETDCCRHRIARLLRIAHLAPDIVLRCMEGSQPVALTTTSLFNTDLPLDWSEQRALLGCA
jgi:DNA invertase Pin-like site-specific DNA recombinase